MAGLMGALGAIAWGRREADASSVYAGRRALIDYLGAGRQAEKRRSTLPGLVASKAELDEFTARYGRPAFTPPTVAPGTRLRCAVGVDGGSTSTKAVLLAEDGELLGSAYHLSKGHPIEDTVAIFEALRAPVERQGASLDVVAVGTTGYAKDLVGSAIGADVALVETVAHVKAALRWDDAPDVIADVGGQDIKLMFLRDGLVADFRLNTQCSAGNGYYLQATAHSYGIPVEQYADVAFTARDMPQFGHGCAVFMQSDIVACQRLGWSPPEILAGLAAVLPRNVWLYVARMPNLPRLGTRFLLQGGTQNNLAAVKAQVDFIRSRFEGTGREPDVIVHRHAGEAGAIGAALEALDGWRQGRRSGFIGLDAVASLRSRTTRDERTRCRFCTNRCMRTFIDLHVGLAASPQTSRPESSVPLLPGERRVIVAGCDDGTVEQAHELRAARASAGAALRESPNLVAWAAEAVWRSWEPRPVPVPRIGRLAGPGARLRAARAARRGRLRIGMPRVLNMYAYAPLFGGYLESLGVRREAIVYSAVTTEGLFRRGAGRGAIDPCFPAKLALAHVHDLLTVQHEAGRLDAIFFPMFDSLRTPIVATLAADPCPTVTLTPATVKAAFVRARDEFALAGIRYLAPLVSVGERRRFEHQMFEAWGPVLGLTREESDAAVGEGFDALDRYESELRRRARAALDRLAEERGVGIVMLGRAYHHDPGVNHGILEELQRRGYAIFSQSTLPMDADWLDELFGDEVRGGLITHALAIDDVWGASYSANTNEKIWAAKVTARHPNLVALEVSSFKCGLDAPVYTLVEEILGASGTPYFAFKDIDENRPSGSIKLRVETIDYFLSRYRERLRREGVPRQVSALAGTS